MSTDASDDSNEYLPTRASLLHRLKDLGDDASWKEFFDTYSKLIYGVARRTGLTDAEAQDVVQETVISVSRKIEGFVYDPVNGSFKAWLKRLTEWRVYDFLRKKQYQSKGVRLPKEEPLNTTLAELQESPIGEEMEAAWNVEWENHILGVALNRIKSQVPAKQYQLFYYHVVKKFPAKQVAERLKAKLTEVYMAKYRITALLKEEIKALEKRLV